MVLRCFFPLLRSCDDFPTCFPDPIFVGPLSVFDCGFAAQCAGAAGRAAAGPSRAGRQDLDASGERRAGPVCGQHHRALVLRRPRRVRLLDELLEVDRRTIARWQVFWQEQFPQTAFWKVARGFLLPLVDAASLPLELLRRFLHGHDSDPTPGWKGLLGFLSPITITGGLKS